MRAGLGLLSVLFFVAASLLLLPPFCFALCRDGCGCRRQCHSFCPSLARLPLALWPRCDVGGVQRGRLADARVRGDRGTGLVDVPAEVAGAVTGTEGGHGSRSACGLTAVEFFACPLPVSQAAAKPAFLFSRAIVFPIKSFASAFLLLSACELS